MDKLSPWLRIVHMIMRLGIGLLLIWTAVYKLRDLGAFASQIAAYDIIPIRLASILAFVLPWLEFLLGTCLIGGVALAGGWLLAALMFGSFLYAHILVVYRGDSVACGCGLGSGTISLWTVARSAALFTSAVIGYLITYKSGPNRELQASEDLPVPESFANPPRDHSFVEIT
jgi:cobalt-zinc-cadmium efflux system protein